VRSFWEVSLDLLSKALLITFQIFW